MPRRKRKKEIDYGPWVGLILIIIGIIALFTLVSTFRPEFGVTGDPLLYIRVTCVVVMVMCAGLIGTHPSV